ncbi:protein translocase subunit SecDF [Aurantimonas sp. Leaf443]|uniref:protein translocase subunit SecDF n=1 Tax=Aurantimonas sp. Leaf443 TaxID=1736378 RepID=UPI0006FE52D6|nr:protein translocase subunit SecDF [Aurantimonas sp. Leaf443]KQT82558.1 preprotein translocase subunit SecD [Aurantimonas sp. Leaf443]
MLHFSRWKTTLIWLTVLAGVIFALPNFLTQSMRDDLPSWMPDRPMTLGLDLQGGSYILLEVDRQSLIDERVQTLEDEVRQTLRTARVGYAGLNASGQTVTLRLRDPAQAEAARTALQPIVAPVSGNLLTGGAITELQLDEPETGVFTLGLTDQGITNRLSNAVAQSIEVVRRRVDELGTTEPIIQRQGADRIMVQVPGLQDPQRLKQLLNQTAKLSFHLVDQTGSPADVARGGRPPAGAQLLYTNDATPQPVLIQRQVMVSGANLTDAQAGFDGQTNEAVVNIRFDSQGAQRFGSVTQQNVGRPFAIVLDDKVLSAPVIRQPILGGQAQISGSFTVQTANDLAVLLRAGALPATLDVIEERTVGPGLGADSIAAGEMAGIVGAIFVVTFMVLAYGFLGVLANVAMFINVLLLVAILSLLGATLTLPGIAGMVLTMGMAVDSNVLIYERMLEERRNGRSVIQSIDAGFSKALGTIMDANVTTLIAAAVLFYLGSGPVRGFAVTLALGIVTTVFTALTLTRWLVAFWVKRRRPKEVPTGWINFIPHNTKIGFMKVRNWAFSITGALSIASVVGFALFGVNQGIDFTGGTVIELRAKGNTADIQKIRQDVSMLVDGDLQVQEFGSARDVLVRFGVQQGEGETPQATVDAVRGALTADYDFQRVEIVGPTVSGELAWAAVLGVCGALFGIALYVWFRFEWQFALGAIIATAHDVLMMLGFLVLTRLEFNLSSIAAILTIVGYSLNDTVVVFDRIRENLRKFKKKPLEQIIDESLNDTLSRTILTAVTTVLALCALFAFGGEVIRNFVAPMLIGVLVGVYSSIYIAAPVLIHFKLRPETVALPGESEAAGDPPAPRRTSTAGGV